MFLYVIHISLIFLLLVYFCPFFAPYISNFHNQVIRKQSKKATLSSSSKMENRSKTLEICMRLIVNYYESYFVLHKIMRIQHGKFCSTL